jgi:hypothetical protein
MRYTRDIDNNFMFFIGKLGFISGTFNVISESTIKRLINFLHKEVKIRNLNIINIFVFIYEQKYKVNK